MLATVRNRRGIVASVDPFDGDAGRIHLVHIEYNDHGTPTDERLLWELEPGASLEEPNALPNVAAADAMPSEDFDALIRASRWTALSPYLDPDGDGPLSRQPVASPFHGGVCVEDYQLVPLLKALRMPRVSLLLADDVGLGKTIEAGLILQELLLRRRIQRVLILTPASLRLQWRDELREKFSLSFDVVDRRETDLLRRRLGLDANPWRSFSRIVASYHYLRQPDVREQFLSACRTPEGSPHLPWDLLIVDECHNLMPSPYGEDSELCRMLAAVAPRFEHKLFLSATPHNGHTRSFTGLLELLDPVRFSRTNELTQRARRRIGEVFVRRLKRDINAAQTDQPRFCTRRPPVALELKAHPAEAELSQAFDAFRTAVRSLIASGTRQRRRAGAFAVEILGKRLLSCPTAFAESWRRARQGFAGAQAASESEMAAAERLLRQETGDDREAEQRGATAATVTGAWLKQMAGELGGEIQRIESALAALGFDLDGAATVDQTPLTDARFDVLTDLIERLLRIGDEFRADERLIVFTEYKTTLDYLSRRLCECYAENRILTLFGGGGPEGMDESDRENVKAAFNDPASDVRILVATDAASEGLNLQRTARYLLHFDCPWNPSRLEQRNGRLDRYGQARDVTIHHFVADQDPDIRFLGHVIRKADEIREDLGAVNEIFDRAVHRRLIEGDDTNAVLADLDRSVAATRRATALETNTNPGTEIDEVRRAAALATMADEIDLDANALSDTLEAAMAIASPTERQQLEVGEERGVYRIKNPSLPGWNDIIDEAVRLPVANGLGPVPGIAFDPAPFIEQIGELSVFSPRRDALLMHLAHPMMKRALTVLSRCRYASTTEMSPWTVRHGDVPWGADALVLLSIEELAVNELRETFHRWVRTVALPVRSGCLDAALPHTNAHSRRGAQPALDIQAQERARDIFADIEPELKNVLRDHRDSLTAALQRQLEADGEQARRNEDERYRQRQGEVSELIQQTTVRSLEREVQQLQARRAQGELFEMEERRAEIDQSIEKKQEEIALRKRHYEEIRKQLTEERRRILERLLPARYTLAGTAQAFPVAVEIRLPERST